MTITDDGQPITVRGLLSDLRIWLGALGGIAATAVSILAFGQEMIQAPALAAQAMSTAEQAMSTANTAVDKARAANERLNDWGQTLRIVFCTKEDWLSAEAEAQLQCYRIRSGQPQPRGRVPR